MHVYYPCPDKPNPFRLFGWSRNRTTRNALHRQGPLTSTIASGRVGHWIFRRIIMFVPQAGLLFSYIPIIG